MGPNTLAAAGFAAAALLVSVQNRADIVALRDLAAEQADESPAPGPCQSCSCGSRWPAGLAGLAAGVAVGVGGTLAATHWTRRGRVAGPAVIVNATAVTAVPAIAQTAENTVASPASLRQRRALAA